VESARHLAQYLRRADLEEPERDRAARSLQKASERLGALVVATDYAAAEVRIDGELVGKTPLEDAPWYVQPGRHTVVVHKDGYFDARHALDVPIGTPTKVVLLLKPIPAPTASAVVGVKSADSRVPAAPVRDERSGSGTRTVVLASEGLVSLAGLAIGIGYLFAATSADEQVGSYQARLHAVPVQPPCMAPVGSLEQDCRGLHSALSDAERDRTISAVGFVGAGVGVAALVTTLLVWKASGENRPAFRVEVGPGRASATVTWRYQ
jgi:hypothetical protein